MTSRSTKKPTRIDLIEMNGSGRAALLRSIRRQVRQRCYERKLVQSLLKLESLTINGIVVFGNEATSKRNPPSSTKGPSRTRLVNWR
jgi:hypothetical protein